LTQAENALAMSLAAVPIYLLVHRLGWHSNRIGYLQPDDRPISVQAGMPSFGGSYRGSAAPSSAA
jgi:hypothetical protein